MRTKILRRVEIWPQTGWTINERTVRRLVRTLLDSNRRCINYHLDLYWVDGEAIRKLGRRHFGARRLTDVISLNYSSGPGFLQGEIYVCVPVAEKQAKTYGVSLQAEVLRLIAHGVLHLLGHEDGGQDQRQRMHRLENRALAQLSRKPLDKKA
ncbi:rRNA maturation RNase YbeY [bacterium]|nr:rRNA maturation RNase YbeY [bacterium]